MFVQWCIKGIRGRQPHEDPASGLDDIAARAIIDTGEGIRCNCLRQVGCVTTSDRQARLTAANLERHIHDYHNFKDQTPFISLTGGSVERMVALQTNRIRSAQDVALAFATDWGATDGYLFYCWVIVGLKPAASVVGVAEEVRELLTYTRFSPHQLEGEITAKIDIPANQIQRCERWDAIGGGRVRPAGPPWPHINGQFAPPDLVSNIRDLR